MRCGRVNQKTTGKYFKNTCSTNSKNVTKMDIDLMFDFLKQTNDVDEGTEEELDIELTNDSILNFPITPEESEQAEASSH